MLYASLCVRLCAAGSRGRGSPRRRSGQAPAGGQAARRPHRRAEAPAAAARRQHHHRSVKFEGTPPAGAGHSHESDPLCMPEGPTVSEVVLVGPDNGLQNVFVYVKDGLGDRTFTAPATPVVLDQRGCKYSPHVFGAQVGQPVKILNSDGRYTTYTPCRRRTPSSTSVSR